MLTFMVVEGNNVNPLYVLGNVTVVDVTSYLSIHLGDLLYKQIPNYRQYALSHYY